MIPMRKIIISLVVVAAVIGSVWYFQYFFKATAQEPNRIIYAHEPLDGIEKIRSSSSHKAKEESKKARYDYLNRLYQDPKLGRIPNGAGILDVKIAKAIDEQAPIRKSSIGFDWKEAGPSNVGGRTRALAADLNDPETIISAGVAGGIWKSDDAGRNWRQVATNSQMSSVTSIAQDPREGFRNRWYAVGGEHSGSSSPFFIDSGTHYGTGLLYSDDNGENWQFVEVDGSRFRWNGTLSLNSRILVHPSNGALYVATNGRGVIRSTNGGRSWGATLNQQFAPRYTDVQTNRDGSILLQYLSGNAAGSREYTAGFYVSWDNGSNWELIESGQINLGDDGNGNPTARRGVIEFSYSNPNIAYAIVNNGRPTGEIADDISFYRFNFDPAQQSVSVRNLAFLLPAEMGESEEGTLPFNTQGDYNISLAIHPANENTVFLGFTNLYRIRNVTAFTAVTTFAEKRDVIIGGYGVIDDQGFGSFFYTDASGQRDQHPDHHLTIFPDPENRPDYMIAANDGGLYSTEEVLAEGLIEWENLNFGYNVTQFYHNSISPRDGQNIFIGGTQDNGSPYVLIDHPTAGSQSIGDVSSGDGSFSHFGFEFIYSSSQNGRVLRYSLSRNNEYGTNYQTPEGGSNIFLANSSNLPGAGGRQFVHPFAVDRATHGTMYYPAGSNAEGANFQLFRNRRIRFDQNTAQGAWEAIPNLNLGNQITALTTSTEPAGRVVVATSGNGTNELYVINEADSDNPRIQRRIIPNEFLGGNIHNIAINPENADEFIVVFSNYNVVSILHTTNNGLFFRNIEGNLAGTEATGDELFGLSVRTANILPYNGQNIYLVGTSAGLYSTTELNGENTVWVKESPGIIGDVPVTWIDSRPSDGTVVVATHARGAFWGKAEEMVTSLEDTQQPLQVELQPNYPNPFNPSTNIAFSLNQASRVNLEIFDMRGSKVATIVDDRLAAGEHQYAFNASNLPSGVYIYRLRAGQNELSRKMTLLK